MRTRSWIYPCGVVLPTLLVAPAPNGQAQVGIAAGLGRSERFGLSGGQVEEGNVSGKPGHVNRALKGWER
jgi:hypothetical protein